MHTLARLLALLPVLASACTGVPDAHDAPDDHEGERSLERDDLAHLAHEGAFAIAPRITFATPITRVAAMIDVVDVSIAVASIDLGLEARGDDGAWAPVARIWREGPRSVARLDLAPTRTLELRVPLDRVGLIERITWSGGVPEIEGTNTEEPRAIDGVASKSTHALDAGLAGIGVIPREAWGARPSNGCDFDGGKYRMAIHHTAGPESAGGSIEEALRQAQSYHLDGRGYCDLAYHFAVGVDGRIFEGRPLQFRGAHTLNENDGNIGIVSIGCFHPGCGNEPTNELIGANARLVGALAFMFGIPIDGDHIKGHRNHPGQGTECPGDFLHARLDEVRSLAVTGGASPECLANHDFGGCSGSVVTTCNDLNQLGTGDCGFFGAACSTQGGHPHCVHPYCTAELGGETGAFCLDGTRVATCDLGAYSEGDCGFYGATCSENGGQGHCVHFNCWTNLDGADTGHFCVDGTRLGTCTLGAYDEGDCAAFGGTCSEQGGDGHCVHYMCWSNLGGAEDGSFCLDDGTLATCALGAYAETECATGSACVQGASGAACLDPAGHADDEATSVGDERDEGEHESTPDESAPDTSAPRATPEGRAHGAEGCASAPAALPFALVALFALRRRVRSVT